MKNTATKINGATVKMTGEWHDAVARSVWLVSTGARATKIGQATQATLIVSVAARDGKLVEERSWIVAIERSALTGLLQFEVSRADVVESKVNYGRRLAVAVAEESFVALGL
jgi:hypothetical protein